MRVLILDIPRSIIGHPTSFDGRYWMRNGESLEQMSPERLHELLNEADPSFLDWNEPGVYGWDEINSLLAVERYYELTGKRIPNTKDQIDDFCRLHFVERAVSNSNSFYVRRLGAICLARSLHNFPDVEHHTIRVMRLRDSSVADMVADRIFEKGYAVTFDDVIAQILRLRFAPRRMTEGAVPPRRMTEEGAA